MRAALMTSPAKHRRLWYLLRPASVWLFLFLCGLWLAAWALRPDGLWESLGGFCRFSGYLAFLLVLVHSRAQAHSLLTRAIVVLLWLVMLSGAAGFYGQKLLYWLLP